MEKPPTREEKRIARREARRAAQRATTFASAALVPVPKKEHPLATAQSLAAFTVAALFWGVGVAMIDPRIGVGVLLCLIGVAATFWLFWASIKAISRTNVRSWPWLGLALLGNEIGIPGYMLYVRADEPNKPHLEIARVEIKKVEVSGPTPTFELSAVTSIKNTSHADATITRVGSQPLYTSTSDVLTEEQEEQDWQIFLKGLKRNEKSTLQITAGAAWKSEGSFSILGKEEYEMFRAGQFLIYFQQLIEYRDDNLPIGKYRVTETCYFYRKDFVRSNLCHSHNRIYISD